MLQTVCQLTSTAAHGLQLQHLALRSDAGAPSHMVVTRAAAAAGKQAMPLQASGAAPVTGQ
jgi:hypothetical protein